MAFIPVPTVAQVMVHGRIDGQVTINNLYFAAETPPVTLPYLQSLADDIGTWYSSTVLTFLSSAFELVFVSARDLTTQAGFQALSVVGSGFGGAGGAFVPNNVAPAISLRSAISGRSGRGRNYIPGVAQSAIDGNRMTPAFLTDMRAAYEQLMIGGALKPGGWSWVVVSRYTGGAPRPAGVANFVEQVLFTDDIVDSQRRRLPGRGV